jgi:hypothetical protein
MAINRVREIRVWLQFRYGDVLPDDDGARDDLELLINYVVQVNRSDPVGAAVREARAWAPWFGQGDGRHLAERALQKPIKFKADTIARPFGDR